MPPGDEHANSSCAVCTSCERSLIRLVIAGSFTPQPEKGLKPKVCTGETVPDERVGDA